MNSAEASIELEEEPKFVIDRRYTPKAGTRNQSVKQSLVRQSGKALLSSQHILESNDLAQKEASAEAYQTSRLTESSIEVKYSRGEPFKPSKTMPRAPQVKQVDMKAIESTIHRVQESSKAFRANKSKRILRPTTSQIKRGSQTESEACLTVLKHQLSKRSNPKLPRQSSPKKTELNP